jgi:subtilisin family serine protease
VGGSSVGFGDLDLDMDFDDSNPNFYLIQLSGPLMEDWRAQLQNLDVDLLEYLPQNSYTARLLPDQVQGVRDLPFVLHARLYREEDTGAVSGTLGAGAPSGPPPGASLQMKAYDLRLHLAEDLPVVLGKLSDLGVSVAGASGRKVRVYLLEEDPRAEDIVAMPEVAAMEEYVPPRLHNDVARQIMGLDADESANPGFRLSGEGEIVGVADTGLDETHPDFKGRVVGVVALGRPGDSTDPNGHGTHVAGSVLGSGAASKGKFCGTAPQAQLFFQSLLDSTGGLGGLPLNLADLFEEAYQAGARIHNNSWGASTRSMYTLNSIDVDEFIAGRRDMLIVISAGNEGDASNCVNSKKGFVDWLSIGSPATAKNALTVGASRSSRTKGGIARLTYAQVWPNNFPDPPISGEKVSGDPECIAAFSSRGPCDDRRIKPDLVAPGTDILSTKSSRAPLRNFWGAYASNSRYAYMGGTSMAAPLVSGTAALVREHYVKERSHQPSAALLKATLINGTRSLKGADSIADHDFTPNYHQGFGMVYLPTTLPNLAFPNMKLEFVDNWEDAGEQFDRTGQRMRYRFSIAGGPSLRITMAYTDLPARALQNNLNLFVQHSQSGQKWIGNTQLPMGLKIPDPDNNVEMVRIENPPAGDYLIQISVTNLLKGPQDFALVVTGDLSTGLQKV